MKFLLLIFLIFSPLLGLCQEVEEDFRAMDPMSELKSLGYKEISIQSLFDPRVIKVLKRALAQSNLRTLPRDDVKKMVQNNLKNHPLEKIFLKSPKTFDCFVDIMRDDKALPGILGIFEKKKELQYFAYGWMILFFLSMWFKSSVIPKEKPFYVRFPAGILYSLVFTAIVGGAFYTLFQAELSPTVNVIRLSLRT